MWQPEELWSYWLRHQDQWLQANDAFRRECRRRFMMSCTLASEEAFAHWKNSVQGCLGLVLLLDTIPRLIYHKLDMAYAQVPRARSIALEARRLPQYVRCDSAQRLHFLHPVSLSEKRDRQEIVREELEHLVVDSDPVLQGLKDDLLRRVQEIDRFGRFPADNARLGRRSTPEEEQYLAGSLGIFRA